MQETNAKAILRNVKDYALGTISKPTQWIGTRIQERKKTLEYEETACIIDEISRLLNKAKTLNEELRVRLENSRVRY